MDDVLDHRHRAGGGEGRLRHAASAGDARRRADRRRRMCRSPSSPAAAPGRSQAAAHRHEGGSGRRPGEAEVARAHRRARCANVKAIHMKWGKGGGRAARLSPRQSQRSPGARRAGIDRREGAGRLHLRRCRALGGRQPGGALPAFPRPRRTARRRGAARLRGIHRRARQSLGRRPAGCDERLRPARQSLSRFRQARAVLLLGHVRGRRSARYRSAIARGERDAPSRCCAPPPKSWWR